MGSSCFGFLPIIAMDYGDGITFRLWASKPSKLISVSSSMVDFGSRFSGNFDSPAHENAIVTKVLVLHAAAVPSI